MPVHAALEAAHGSKLAREPESRRVSAMLAAGLLPRGGPGLWASRARRRARLGRRRHPGLCQSPITRAVRPSLRVGASAGRPASGATWPCPAVAVGCARRARALPLSPRANGQAAASGKAASTGPTYARRVGAYRPSGHASALFDFARDAAPAAKARPHGLAVP